MFFIIAGAILIMAAFHQGFPPYLDYDLDPLYLDLGQACLFAGAGLVTWGALGRWPRLLEFIPFALACALLFIGAYDEDVIAASSGVVTMAIAARNYQINHKRRAKA